MMNMEETLHYSVNNFIVCVENICILQRNFLIKEILKCYNKNICGKKFFISHFIKKKFYSFLRIIFPLLKNFIKPIFITFI